MVLLTIFNSQFIGMTGDQRFLGTDDYRNGIGFRGYYGEVRLVCGDFTGIFQYGIYL
jgi:hypothetical protein